MCVCVYVSVYMCVHVSECVCVCVCLYAIKCGRVVSESVSEECVRVLSEGSYITNAQNILNAEVHSAGFCLS